MTELLISVAILFIIVIAVCPVGICYMNMVWYRSHHKDSHGNDEDKETS